MKLKIAVLCIFLVIGGFGFAIGPGLGMALKKIRKKKKDASSPKLMYQIGTIYFHTGRKEQARKVFEEYWLLYADDTQCDWELVIEQNTAFTDPDSDESYCPWITRKMMAEDKERPPPVRAGPKEKEYLGEVLVKLAKYFEEKRQYPVAKHIWICLSINWPEGSPAKRAGMDGVKRGVLSGW